MLGGLSGLNFRWDQLVWLEFDLEFFREGPRYDLGHIRKAKGSARFFPEGGGPLAEDRSKALAFLWFLAEKVRQKEVFRTDEKGAVLEHSAGVAPLGAPQDLATVDLELVTSGGRKARGARQGS